MSTSEVVPSVYLRTAHQKLEIKCDMNPGHGRVEPFPILSLGWHFDLIPSMAQLTELRDTISAFLHEHPTLTASTTPNDSAPSNKGQVGPFELLEGGNFVRIGLKGYREWTEQNSYLGGPLSVATIEHNATINLDPDHEQAMQYGRLFVAAPDLLAACQTVKAFLANLENGTESDDPLRTARNRVHGPLHAVLDAAIGKALGL